MRRIAILFWGALALMTVLWLAVEPQVFGAASFVALRDFMAQYTGVLAMTCMSLALILALRPRWPEGGIGGLDKMYRLHKWLGIGGGVLAVLHWGWSHAPKWATTLGLLSPRRRGGPRGPAPVFRNPIQQAFSHWHGHAQHLAQWPFYAAILLIAVALIHAIPYRLFYKTHRLLAVAYLVLVVHGVVLLRFQDWASPLGVVLAALEACGSYAAVVVLLRRVAARRKVEGTIVRVQHYPALQVLAGEVDVPDGWPGHRAGQFAFVTSSASEGAHPYSIASSWDPAEHRMTFVVKELGDWTRRLRETLREGARVRIEGPYGRFTFDDSVPRQIWVSGGIGITPFLARMRQLAADRRDVGPADAKAEQRVDLFHATSQLDDAVISRLQAEADAAGVKLHVLHSRKHGRLTAERLRTEVPGWRDASIWFCGPAAFGSSLRDDFARAGFPVRQRFHQELFAMR